MLDEELGLEPSPALRELEGAVLRQDPDLDAPSRVRALAPREKRRSGMLLAAAAAMLGFAGAATAVVLLQRHDVDGRRQRRCRTASRRRPPRRLGRRPRRRGGWSSFETDAQRRSPKRARLERRPVPRRNRYRLLHSLRLRGRRRRRRLHVPAPGACPRLLRDHQRSLRSHPSGSPTTSTTGRNGTLWHQIITGTGITLAERNGRLEIEFAADGVAGGDFNVLGAHYGTQCRFLGDFDARVDFELGVAPLNGVQVALNAWFARRGGVMIARQSQTWDEEYMSWADPRSNSRPTLDLRGSLRVKRVGNTISTHYKSGKEALAGRAHRRVAHAGDSGDDQNEQLGDVGPGGLRQLRVGRAPACLLARLPVSDVPGSRASGCPATTRAARGRRARAD